MWKPPARRDYHPKANDPGQPIAWIRHEPGHHTRLPGSWNEPLPADAEWIPARDIERTGTIWSAGPRARTVWVKPDDSDDMVVVCAQTEHEQRWDRTAVKELPSYPADWQRDTIRRCDHLNASDGLFREYKIERLWHGSTQELLVAYHCDPNCAAIEHRTGMTGYLTPTVGEVTRSLLNGAHRTDLCKTCIWLNPEPQEAAA